MQHTIQYNTIQYNTIQYNTYFFDNFSTYISVCITHLYNRVRTLKASLAWGHSNSIVIVIMLMNELVKDILVYIIILLYANFNDSSDDITFTQIEVRND